MARQYVDCREYPTEVACSLRISGEEEEVMIAAVDHAVKVHGETDSPEFRRSLRDILKPDQEVIVGTPKQPETRPTA